MRQKGRRADGQKQNAAGLYNGLSDSEVWPPLERGAAWSVSARLNVSAV